MQQLIVGWFYFFFFLCCCCFFWPVCLYLLLNLCCCCHCFGFFIFVFVFFCVFFFHSFVLFLRRKCSFHFNVARGMVKLWSSAGHKISFCYFQIVYKFEVCQGSLAVIRELLFYIFQIFLLVFSNFSSLIFLLVPVHVFTLYVFLWMCRYVLPCECNIWVPQTMRAESSVSFIFLEIRKKE